MKTIVLLLFLQLFLHTFVAAQQSEKSNDCNYKILLSDLQEKDKNESQVDPEVLLKMARLAARSDEFKLAEKYYRRITNDPLEKSMAHFQAMVYLSFGYDDSISLDSLRREVIEVFGDSHELLAVINIVENDKAFRAKKNIPLDSVVHSNLPKIINKERYKKMIAVALQSISRDYADKGKFQKGIEAAKALKQFVFKYYPICSEEISSVYITIGRRFLDNDQLDSAAVYIERAYNHDLLYSQNQISAVTKSAINLSDIVGKQGDFERSIALLEEAIQHAKKDSIVAAKMFPSIYNSLGIIHKTIGSYNKSIQYYRQVILYAEQASVGPSVNKIAAYFNTGTQFFELGEIQQAEEYHLKALDLCMQLLGEKHRFTAMVLMSLGSIEFEKGNYEKCESYFEKSLKIRKEIYGAEHASLANVYFNYGYLYQDLNQFDKARYYSQKVTHIYKKQYELKDARVARALLRQASIESEAKDFSNSIKYLVEAKDVLLNQGGYKGSTNSLLYLDVVANEAILDLNELILNDRGNIESIIAKFEHAMEVFDYHINLNDEIADISNYAGNYPGLFDQYLMALLYKYRKDNDKSTLLKAYQVNDKGKSLGMLSTLSQRAQLMFTNVPKSKRLKLKTLKSEARRLEQKIEQIGVAEMANEKNVLDSLIEIQQQIERLDVELKESFPAYAQIKNSGILLEPSTIIPPDGSETAIMDYRIVDSTLVCFSLFDGDLNVNTIPLPSGFQKLIDEFVQNIINSEPEKGTEEINDLLIKKFWNFPDHINKIVLIPDEYLSVFPFELLFYEGESILDRFAISYANSSSILKLQNAVVTVAQPNSFAGFAPVYDQKVDTIEVSQYAYLVRAGTWELPFAQTEVNTVSGQLNGKVWLGAEANKNNFFEALKNSTTVHLSMHAEANNEQPMNSRFVFDPSSDDDTNNLLLYELYNLQSNASLVVLSACETGKGSYHKGDGIRSLGNGFLYAGVPSVVMSLWKVPDESTSKIMTAFYKHLQSGASKSQALRQAKLDYLENVIAVEQRHPYYWAGFVLAGNDDPIDLGTNWNIKVVLLLSVAVLVLFWFFRRK
ncbi:MAG: CHAT domain-containing protein [Saprospiraceae bacterium]|nr:CHAT domain-containing protein [Saprospiraceae bacterium]